MQIILKLGSIHFRYEVSTQVNYEQLSRLVELH